MRCRQPGPTTRPAYLEVKETAPGQFSVLWRTPVLAGMRLPIVLKLPDRVKNLEEPVVSELTDSLVERRRIDAGPNGLAGELGQLGFIAVVLAVHRIFRVLRIRWKRWAQVLP